jgi:hypothetical protein
MFERRDERIAVVKRLLDDDWIAECGVCEGNFVITAEDSPEIPSKSGTFCPDCRANNLKAPGVLHWRRRNAA